jgi:hypothetical protein
MQYKNQSQFQMYRNGINYLHKDEILNEASTIQTSRGCTGSPGSLAGKGYTGIP